MKMRRYKVNDEQWEKIKIILTAGNVNDCDVACELLDNFNLKGKIIIADRGYSTFAIKKFIETCGAECCIPPKTNFKRFWDYDKEKYKTRNKVERFFGHLKEKRWIATRFDKLVSRFLSFVYLASIFY